jgi:hypothetical protein
MWPKRALFCCLSFLLLRLLAHNNRNRPLQDPWLEDRWSEDPGLIATLRASGTL